MDPVWNFTVFLPIFKGIEEYVRDYSPSSSSSSFPSAVPPSAAVSSVSAVSYREPELLIEVWQSSVEDRRTFLANRGLLIGHASLKGKELIPLLLGTKDGLWTGSGIKSRIPLGTELVPIKIPDLKRKESNKFNVKTHRMTFGKKMERRRSSAMSAGSDSRRNSPAGAPGTVADVVNNCESL